MVQTVLKKAKKGTEVVFVSAYYNCAVVFVFSGRIDIFGLVLAKAVACGMPVPAYPVEGAIDVVAQRKSGMPDEDRARLL